MSKVVVSGTLRGPVLVTCGCAILLSERCLEEGSEVGGRERALLSEPQAVLSAEQEESQLMAGRYRLTGEIDWDCLGLHPSSSSLLLFLFPPPSILIFSFCLPSLPASSPPPSLPSPPFPSPSFLPLPPPSCLSTSFPFLPTLLSQSLPPFPQDPPASASVPALG